MSTLSMTIAVAIHAARATARLLAAVWSEHANAAMSAKFSKFSSTSSYRRGVCGNGKLGTSESLGGLGGPIKSGSQDFRQSRLS
jgi:hypothetical protein